MKKDLLRISHGKHLNAAIQAHLYVRSYGRPIQGPTKSHKRVFRSVTLLDAKFPSFFLHKEVDMAEIQCGGLTNWKESINIF